MARGDFQDNAISLTQPNLSGLGNDVLAAVSGVDMLATDKIDKAVDDAISRDLAKAETDEFNGRISGSVEGQNKLSLFNTKQLRERLMREARKKGDFDILLMELAAERLALLDRLDSLNEYEDALDRCIDALERGEELPRNPDGSLQDEDAEKAIREYEEEHGVTVDRSDLDALNRVLGWIHDEQGHVLDGLEVNDAKAKDLGLSDRTEHSQIISVMVTAESLDEQLIVDKAVADLGDDQARVAASTINETEDDQEYVQKSVGNDASESIFSIGDENPFASGDLTNVFETASNETTLEPSDPAPSNGFDFIRPDQG